MEISKEFLSMTIKVTENYNGIDEYLKLLKKVIYAFKSTSPFFKCLRIGLRKINICLVNDLNDINNYFTVGAFNLNETLNYMNEFSSTGTQCITLLNKDKYKINYQRSIQEGIMNFEKQKSKKIYQVQLDIDVYSDDIKANRTLLSNEQNIQSALIKLNTIVFEIFYKSLEQNFIEKLYSTNFEDNSILGVK